MKQLIIVRHAKSSWDQTVSRDFDRPLNARGERDAPRMAERLAERVGSIDALVSSTAVRALSTARIFARAFEFDPEQVRGERGLYLSTVEDMLAIVREFDDDLERVALFGHNPGVQYLMEALTARTVESVPTCTVCELSLRVERWGEVDPGCAVIADFDYPKRQES